MDVSFRFCSKKLDSEVDSLELCRVGDSVRKLEEMEKVEGKLWMMMTID